MTDCEQSKKAERTGMLERMHPEDRPYREESVSSDDYRRDAAPGDYDRDVSLSGDSYDYREGPGERVSMDGAAAPLFVREEADRFRSRWLDVQTGFVDEPRQAVEQADELVREVTDRLVDTFTRGRDDLERQWRAGEDVSTEDLRQSMQRYRSFFERLLSL